MITAIGLGFLGILLSVLGMKCSSVGASNHKAKARTALLGGLLLGVASACTGASVSYYGAQVVQQYFNPVLPQNQPLYLRFEYGSALYIGWVTLVIGKYLIIYSASSDFSYPELSPKPDLSPLFFGHENVTSRRMHCMLFNTYQ